MNVTVFGLCYSILSENNW